MFVGVVDHTSGCLRRASVLEPAEEDVVDAANLGSLPACVLLLDTFRGSVAHYRDEAWKRACSRELQRFENGIHRDAPLLEGTAMRGFDAQEHPHGRARRTDALPMPAGLFLGTLI